MTKEKDIDFIRLSTKSLCESMIYHSREWMKNLATQLNEFTRRRLYEIKSKLDVSDFKIIAFYSNRNKN